MHEFRRLSYFFFLFVRSHSSEYFGKLIICLYLAVILSQAIGYFFFLFQLIYITGKIWCDKTFCIVNMFADYPPFDNKLQTNLLKKKKINWLGHSVRPAWNVNKSCNIHSITARIFTDNWRYIFCEKKTFFRTVLFCSQPAIKLS